MSRPRRRLPWPFDATLIVLADSLNRFQRHRCTTAAAAIGFHVLFSIFPLILLIAALVGTRMQDPAVRQSIIDGLMSALPLDPSARGQLDDVLRGANANLPAVGVLGALALVWSASGMLSSVRGAMELAWEGYGGTRPFFRGKLIDALVLGIIVAVILSGFLVGVAVSFSAAWPEDQLPAPGALRDVLEATRAWIGVAASFGATALTMTLAYKLLPHPRPRLAYAVPGAVLAALAFELARRAFAIYLASVARYDVVYGSIGSIIAFLFLVYIGAMILLWGAELGASLRRVDRAGRLRPRRGAPAADA
jgi:membrane protein